MEMGTIFLRPGLKEDLVVVTRYLDDISDEGGTLGTGGKMGPWRSQGAIGIEGGWQKDAGGGPCVEGRHGRREEGVGSAVTSDGRLMSDFGHNPVRCQVIPGHSLIRYLRIEWTRRNMSSLDTGRADGKYVRQSYGG